MPIQIAFDGDAPAPEGGIQITFDEPKPYVNPADLVPINAAGESVASRRAAFRGPPKEEIAPPLAAKPDGGMKALHGELTSLADLVLSIPAMAVGSVMDPAFRALAMAQGKDRRTQGEEGRAAAGVAQDVLGSPLKKLLAFAGLGQEDPSNVDQAMGKVSDLIKRGGSYVEAKTGGWIQKEDVESLADELMAIGGVHGMKAGIRKAVGPEEAKAAQLFTAPQLKAAFEARRSDMNTTATTKAFAEDQAAAAAEAATTVRKGSTEGKVLNLNPVTGELNEAIPEIGKDYPRPSTLDTALEKVRNGQAFNMTAEERVQYRAWKAEPPPEPLVDEAGRPLASNPGRTNYVVGALAAGAAAYGASKLEPEDQNLVVATGLLAAGLGRRGLSLEELGKLSDNAALGDILSQSEYTTKTLDRLPQNKAEFSKNFIEQELKRADVTDAERGSLRAALEQFPGEKISAKNLMLGVKKATGDFELRREPTSDYADYGLQNIGRTSEEAAYDRAVDRNYDPSTLDTDPLRATTSLYRLPEHMTLSDANHFSDPNLFGWTRSFEEGGKRHVVEIQSDLAQHAKESLSPEVVAALKVEQKSVEASHAALDEILTKWHNDQQVPRDAIEPARKAIFDATPEMGPMGPSGIPGGRIQAAFKRLGLRLDEIAAKLGGGAASQIAPIIKNWPKRLVREELANAAESGEQSVRFATAETVAKVEGWPKRNAPERDAVYRAARDLKVAADSLSDYKRLVAPERDHTGRPFDTEQRAAQAETIAQKKQAVTRLTLAYDAATEAFETAKAAGKDLEPKLSPEHQSIFDRYSRDIEKFLKQQGGKPYTDSAGHTWLEVPTPKVGPKQMYGRADPKLLARIAVIGGGAWLAQHYSSEKDLFHLLLGAGLGLAATSVNPLRAARNIARAFGKDTRLSIDDLASGMEKAVQIQAHDIWGLQKQIETLVPAKARREAISHAVEAGPAAVAALSPSERAAAKIWTNFRDALGAEASLEGILKGGVNDYVTHIWDWSKNDKGLIQKWLDSRGGAGVGTPFTKERSVPTLAEGKLQGLTPLTEDISTILGIYGNSMSRAIANAVFTRALKSESAMIPSNTGPTRPVQFVMAAEHAPHSYVSVNAPNLLGMRVHPDIAPQLKMLYNTSQPGVAMKVMLGISDTAKRIAVSLSAFHVKALTDALIAGGSHPLKSLREIPRFVAGTSEYLKELKKGSTSTLVQDAAEGGLKYSLEKSNPAVEDAGANFYSTMKSVQGFLDKAVPHAGLPVEGFVKINHMVDTLMWARIHAGMKLMIFSEKMNQLLVNSAREAAAGRGAALDRSAAARIAASYTNDLFGGLNWRRVAEDSKTRFGKDIARAMLNSAARQVNGLLLFAPDWTISTTRAFTQAFGGGTGLRGIVRPTTLADLHRQYLVRAAVYYLIVGDTINLANSGHHLWENKDPTTLDMDPKGQTHMQWSKHTMEPIHWMTKPGQQALNKLGMIPRELLAQGLGVEYLSASGRMPPMKSRLRHLAQNFIPIAGQQAQEGGAARAAAGFAGFPIYGRTAEQRAKDRAEKKARTKVKSTP